MSEFDPGGLIGTLVDHEVRFVLIGGMAAVALGSPMVTWDVDICYARDPDNLARLAEALRELEARLRGVTEDVPFLLDAETLAAGDHFTFTTSLGPLDVLGTPSGSEGYEALMRNAVELDLEGMAVHVVSLNDLIRMKRAAGRPKDRIALENLGALRDVLEEDD